MGRVTSLRSTGTRKPFAAARTIGKTIAVLLALLLGGAAGAYARSGSDEGVSPQAAKPLTP